MNLNLLVAFFPFLCETFYEEDLPLQMFVSLKGDPMDSVQEGEVLYCSSCGIKLQVVEACKEKCDCTITCCGKEMSVSHNEVDG